MRLNEIKNQSRSTHNKIKKIAESIHPKLVSRLQFKDFYDDTLMDNSLQLRFNDQVLPLITEYHRELKEMKDEYIDNMFLDFLELDDVEDIGIDLDTGIWVSQYNGWRSAGDFLPDSRIAFMYTSVRELHLGYTSLKGFWENSSYVIYSPDKQYSVSSSSTPEHFIKSARNMMKDSAPNAVHLLLNSAKIANDIGYKIHIPPLSQYDERHVSNSTIVKAVQRHAKLKAFLEGSHVKDRSSYWTHVDSDGNYNFNGNGGKY